MQHNGLTWVVDRTSFVYAEDRDKFSNETSRILKNWIDGIEPSKRKQLVDAVFDVFEAGGIVEIFDFKEINMKKATAMLKATAALPQELRDTVNRLIKSIVEVIEKIKRKWR